MKKLALFVGLAAAFAAGVLIFLPSERDDPKPTSSSGEEAAEDNPTVPVVRETSARGAELAGGVLDTERCRNLQSESDEQVDPNLDGWDTEVLNNQAMAKLKKIAAFMEDQNDKTTAEVTALAGSSFSSAPLRPANLTQVWQAEGIAVYREPGDTAPQPATMKVSSLQQALQALTAPFQGGSDIHVKFKLFRINVLKDEAGENEEAHTRVYYLAYGKTADGRLQQNATWDCAWTKDGKNELKLKSVAVSRYEEVTSRLPGNAPLFADCTISALDQNASFGEQLLRGANYWSLQIPRTYRDGIAPRYGIAVGDVNGDGLEDLYVCQPGGLPNRLYVQDGSGRAVDRSAESGLDWLDRTASAVFVDLDNDGDQDLVAAMAFCVVVLSNDSKGHFEVRHQFPIADYDVHAVSAVDYDNDSDLDIFVTVAGSNESKVPFVYWDARNGGRNYMLRNDITESGDGEWLFPDVTEEVGLGEDNFRHTLAAAWEDFDNDGDQDLYIANDYSVNALYRNDGGKFVNITREAGVLDAGSGMSVSWADFNRDGLIDLYVGNMFSSAGNRITRQTQRLSKFDPETLALIQRFAKGNTLYQNLGGGKFREVSDPAGVEMGRWAWSSLFVDINNDSWEDIFVVNGFITNDNPDDL